MRPNSLANFPSRSDAYLAAIDLRNLKQAVDMHAIVSIADSAGTITYVNDKFCEISGYRREELLGKNHRMLKSSYHPDAFFLELWDTIASGKTWQGEIRNRSKCGEHYWVASTIVPFLDEAGRPYQYVSIRTEITQQKKMQEAIAVSAIRYRNLVDHVPVGIFELDSSGKCYYVNDRWSQLANLDITMAAGDGWMDAVHHEDRQNFFQKWNQARESRLEFRLECRFGVSINKLRWVTVTASAYQDAEGNITGYLGSVSDITSIKQNEVELQVAKLTAEAASRAKSDFLSRMSHELRTPLNAIIGFSQLMDCDKLDPLSPSQAESNIHILKAGRHLLELINEVLDLSRIETDSFDIHEEKLPIGNLVADCIAMAAPYAHKYGVTINFTDGPECQAWGDDRRLRQVLLNLLSNAIKYNRKDGSVSVSWMPSGNMLRLRVQDTGLGIPEEKLDALFEPFNRLAFENSGIEGAGIGLTIARRLMELMHGSIGVESKVGEGSTFWIDIPILASADQLGNPVHE